MKDTNYKLPLDFSRFFTESGGHLEQCTELESIDQNLGLILTTRQGEHSFDRLFGTKVGEMDFENIVSRSVWEEKFVGYVRQAIQDNERRLKEVQVRIKVDDVLREEASMSGFSVRKRVHVIIEAIAVSTNKPAAFKHTLYLGPLSKD